MASIRRGRDLGPGRLLVAALLVLAGCGGPWGRDDEARTSVAGCPEGRLVRSAGALSDALRSARPGDVVLVAGRLEGRFAITRSGTAAAPIVLCGGPGAVLDGGSTTGGYTLHLDGADHWQVEGLTVRGAAKGVVLDDSSDNRLERLAVAGTGEEGVHLRRGSSRNVLRALDVSRTGLRTPRLGEGVYVGSAESNWCELTGCAPDRSDDNQVVDSRISATGAETIDVKEGTTGGTLRGNRLDGAGSTADSLVDLKGDAWTVEGNVGVAAPGTGVAIYRILAGWGRRNVVRDNRVDVPAGGWAVDVVGAARAGGNVVDCSNVAVRDGRPDASRVAPGGCS